jgi:very-short-patch-repair endonuclease
MVDLYCRKVQLIIEIDGVIQNGKQSYDTLREYRLKGVGLNVF